MSLGIYFHIFLEIGFVKMYQINQNNPNKIFDAYLHTYFLKSFEQKPTVKAYPKP